MSQPLTQYRRQLFLAQVKKLQSSRETEKRFTLRNSLIIISAWVNLTLTFVCLAFRWLWVTTLAARGAYCVSGRDENASCVRMHWPIKRDPTTVTRKTAAHNTDSHTHSLSDFSPIRSCSREHAVAGVECRRCRRGEKRKCTENFISVLASRKTCMRSVRQYNILHRAPRMNFHLSLCNCAAHLCVSSLAIYYKGQWK